MWHFEYFYHFGNIFPRAISIIHFFIRNNKSPSRLDVGISHAQKRIMKKALSRRAHVRIYAIMCATHAYPTLTCHAPRQPTSSPKPRRIAIKINSSLITLFVYESESRGIGWNAPLTVINGR